MNSRDVFHIIGFTGANVLNGVHMGTLELSNHNMREMIELHSRFGPHAVAQGAAGCEEVEVYFLSALGVSETFAMAKVYGAEYQIVEFFNSTALKLCGEYGITLPVVIGQTTRAQLPERLATSMRFPCYARMRLAMAAHV